MKIWLVTIGEPLPTDRGSERLHRAGILAEMLVAAGHEVVWWTSTFNHSTKELRAKSSTTVTVSPHFTIHMLHGGGYRRNVSLARIRDHRRIAREFQVRSVEEVRPDAIIASLPSLELCEEAVRYGQATGVPTVVDVRDLWPDVFEDAVPSVLRPFAPVAMEPMRRIARSACTGASAIWGHAPAFVEWGLTHARRARSRFDRSFAFGYVDSEPSESDQSDAMAFWDSMGVTSHYGGLTACFIGSIGHQTKVAEIIEAASELGSYPHVRFVICGDGDRYESICARASGLNNVVLPGWQRRAAIWTLLRRSHVGIATYVHRADFLATIPNKVPEYLSGGLAIGLNLESGLTHDLITRHECGFSYQNDPRELAMRLHQLHEDRRALDVMRSNARALFALRFRADAVYGEMIETLEALVRSRRSGQRRMAYK